MPISVILTIMIIVTVFRFYHQRGQSKGCWQCQQSSCAAART